MIGSQVYNSHPFGKDNYNERYLLDTQHLDQVRIAWVEATLADNSVGDE